MTVIATAKGYYAGRIIEAGEPVPLAKGDDLASWMMDTEATEVEAPVKPAKGGPDTDVKPPVKPAKGTDPVTGDEI